MSLIPGALETMLWDPSRGTERFSIRANVRSYHLRLAGELARGMLPELAVFGELAVVRGYADSGAQTMARSASPTGSA